MIKLDLHDHSWVRAKKKFVETYNRVLKLSAKNDRTEWMEVIHGYGSEGKGGAIRVSLRQFLVQQVDYEWLVTVSDRTDFDLARRQQSRICLGFMIGEDLDRANRPSEDARGNPGITIVAPIAPLKDLQDYSHQSVSLANPATLALADEIYKYCVPRMRRSGRALSEIQDHFEMSVAYESEIREAILFLEVQGRLCFTREGRDNHYEGIPIMPPETLDEPSEYDIDGILPVEVREAIQILEEQERLRTSRG